MEKAKLNVSVAFFSYAGNGGVRCLDTAINRWWGKLYHHLMSDERVGQVVDMYPGDTPLTMERNAVVKAAKSTGTDVLVMIDNDNVPDGGEAGGKPFFQTSFDFLYERKMRGLPTVVCAPYCGPPPHPIFGGEENVYVFHWEGLSNDENPAFSVKCYGRHHATIMKGIQPIAAGPTGVIMYDMAAFDLMPVNSLTQEDILDAVVRGEMTKERAMRLLNMHSWFFYEYTDKTESQKASTEDVTNTREIAMAGHLKYGTDVVFCNWDAWAGHRKPQLVGKPKEVRIDHVSAIYQEAVERNVRSDERIMDVDFTKNLAPVENNGQYEHTMAPYTVAPRVVAGRKVSSIGFQTGQQDLDALTELVEWVAGSRPDKPLRIIEVGSWVGESAIALQAGLGPAGGTVYCVENFRGSEGDATGSIASYIGQEKLKDTFRKNLGDLLNNQVRLLYGSSLEMAKEMDPQDADLIFIDATHTYEACKADIEAWMRHLAPNGVLVGHDYNENFPGVIQAVNELVETYDAPWRLMDGTALWVVEAAHMKQPEAVA